MSYQVLKNSTHMTPADAYWNQRFKLLDLKHRFEQLGNGIGFLTDLALFQWAQIGAFVLEFKPELVIELGRGYGNSTCMFTEIANSKHKYGGCDILSLCWSDTFRNQTLPHLFNLKCVNDSWLNPLTFLEKDILTFNFEELLGKYNRVLVFWDAHGFEVANCVLGNILPLIQNIEHFVLMHDLSDQRYLPKTYFEYNNSPTWHGDSHSQSRLVIGNINSAVAQAISIVDFCNRNKIHLESADHTFHEQIKGSEKEDEMRSLLGETFFSLHGHWFYFSLNQSEGPFFFPEFISPSDVE